MTAQHYDLELQRRLLWAASKPVLRPVARWRWPSRALSSQFMLILGSQRSGTTLMFLMLTAHPRITGLDENHAGFDLPPWPVVATNALRGKRTLYKLPTLSSEIERVADAMPRASIIWMIRHPYAVVASMRALKFDDGKSWIQKWGRVELATLKAQFPELEAPQYDLDDDVTLAAMVWKYKLASIARFIDRGLNIIPIRYEDLVEDPEETLRGLLQTLKVPWSANVLEHHRFHGSERHAGNTRGDMPVDASRRRRGEELSDNERARVDLVCDELMRRHHYL